MDYPALNSEGVRVLPTGENVRESYDFFAYELDFTSALANGATATSSFTVQADSVFWWQAGTYITDLAGAAQTDSTRVVPLVTCQIQDSGTGRNLFSAPAPIPNVFGTGMQPFILPQPRRFLPNTQVTVTLTNYSAATSYATIRLSFIGTKVFAYR